MMLFQSFFLFILFYPTTIEMIRINHKRRHMSSSFTKLDLTVNAVYNKLYQRSLNLNQTHVYSIEPHDRVWFSITNGTIYALPLFGDYAGPFKIQISNPKPIELRLKYHFAPSTSLFSPSNHLLLALFNTSSINRYLIIQTLSLALNLSETLITIHRINGSMTKVYFSLDFYSSKDLIYDIKTVINYYYLKRLELIKKFSFPLIEISIVRLAKYITTSTSTLNMGIHKGQITIQPRLLNNRTVVIPTSLILFNQFYQPLVLVPLTIILLSLIICTIIAFCLCCNRRSSSSSTLLLPSGINGQPNNKHLYQNYTYHKHRQQQEIYRKTSPFKDQRQFISKGIPVVFAEELDEKLEQTHTPLVMRIERSPISHDEFGKASL